MAQQYSQLRAIKSSIKGYVPASLRPIIRQAWTTVQQTIFWSGRPLSATLPSGIQVRVATSSDWAAYNDIFAGGEYDEAIDQVLTDDDPLVVDLGANVGYFSLRVADLWRRYRGEQPYRLLAVEGAPGTFDLLVQNLYQPVLKGRFKAYHALVGKRSGSAQISTSVRSVNNSVVDHTASFTMADVPYLDLEQVLPADQRIALMKIDIEGSEEVLFESYPKLLKRVDRLVIELHTDMCNVPHCLAMLNEAGFPPGQRLRAFGDATVMLFERREAV